MPARHLPVIQRVRGVKGKQKPFDMRLAENGQNVSETTSCQMTLQSAAAVRHAPHQISSHFAEAICSNLQLTTWCNSKMVPLMRFAAVRSMDLAWFTTD